MTTLYEAYHSIFDVQNKSQFYLGWIVGDTYVQTPVSFKQPSEKDDSLKIIFKDNTSDNFCLPTNYGYRGCSNLQLMDSSNFSNIVTLTLNQDWAKNKNRYLQTKKDNEKVEKMVSTFVKMDTEHQEIVLNLLNKLYNI